MSCILDFRERPKGPTGHRFIDIEYLWAINLLKEWRRNANIGHTSLYSYPELKEYGAKAIHSGFVAGSRGTNISGIEFEDEQSMTLFILKYKK